MVENEGLPVTSGKTDRRVKYSKMVIKESFVQLLKEKNISKITIKELCELADVNRATFYAHYTDQYDLLEQIEQELMSGINQYIISDLFHESTKTPVSMLVKILDFIKDNIVRNMSEKKQILVMRILIIGFIVLSVVIALDPPTFIAQLMGISWGALAGSFLAPFLYGLYWKRTTKAAVWASFATGVGITVSNLFLKYIASPINAGAVAMVAGLVVVPVVSLLSPAPDKTKVQEIFVCYEETVTVHTKKSIEE